MWPWNYTHLLFFSSSALAATTTFCKTVLDNYKNDNSHNMVTLHMLSKIFHFLMSAAGTFLSIACKKTCVRCFRYTFFIQ
jgi:hypothetical protein